MHGLQDIFIQVSDVAETGWNHFHEERAAGINKISQICQRATEEDLNKDEMETDLPTPIDKAPTSALAEDGGRSIAPPDTESTNKVVEMDVADAAGQINMESESDLLYKWKCRCSIWLRPRVLVHIESK